VEQKAEAHSGLQQGGQDEIDLSHLINIIRRAFLRICVITTLVAIIAALFIADLPPIYKASTVLQLQIQQTKPIAIQGVLQNDINNKDYFQTQIEILRSDLITEKVIQQLQLSQYPYYSQHKPRTQFAEILTNLKTRLSLSTTSVQVIDPQAFYRPDKISGQDQSD